MKNVLLIGINAKYIHSNPAIYSLYSYTIEHTDKTVNADCLSFAEYTINQNMETILADIYGRKPDVAAFSCYIWNWNMVQDILVELPKVLPNIQIWLGGPEVSFHAEKILQQYPMVRAVMIGEGEETFCSVFNHYQQDDLDETISNIRGLYLPEGFTGYRELTDINEVPFFYEKMHKSNPELFKNRIIYYESQRGCPFSCAYCLSSIDKKVRIRDFDEVKKHLDFFLEQKIEQVKFIDRTFNCNAKNAYQIWKYIKEHDNGVTNFHFEIAADLLTEEQLELIKDMRAGLIQLEIGVQSTNKKTLEAINRFMSISHLRETVAKVKSFGNIHQHLDLIAGLPYEDYESFGHSFDDVYAMEPEQLQLGFLKVLKGSPMEEKANEYGIVYQQKPPYEVLKTKWLTYDDVLKLKGIEEMVELYYNSSQFEHALKVLEGCFDSPFRLYEELSAYYEKKGYYIQVPSRAYRYQVLLVFMDETDIAKHDLFVECLIFDLYLRENLKSRPGFAEGKASTLPDKEKVRKFYMQEEQNATYLSEYSGYNGVQMAKMTHMESFQYPVWEKDLSKMQKKLVIPQYVLFDYKKRNPLTYDAAYYILGDLS